MAVEVVKPEDIKLVETLVVMKRSRFKEHGSDTVESKNPGEKVKMSGMDKVQAIATARATRDLNWKPDPAKEKAKANAPVLQSPLNALLVKMDKLIDAIEKLAAAKR